MTRPALRVVPADADPSAEALRQEVTRFVQLLCDRRRARWHKTPWPDVKRLAEVAGIDIPEELR